MLTAAVEAILGKRPFDLILHHVNIVNVFNDTITQGSIGIVGERIAFVGEMSDAMHAHKTIEGAGRYAVPGFIDSHMHLESSMLTPPHFARIVLGEGTTTVAADPHEMANVCGLEGVKALAHAAQNLPLRILMMAPSTIPSAPGYEDSGYAVDAAEMEKMLDLPGISGLGEVMDFNAVAAGDARILSVIETAAARDCILDGHASVLTGNRLQAFRATGIDSDHTVPTAAKLHEELALGFTVQVQECMLHEEMVEALNTVSLQNRICLVTDDVPLPRLLHNGHLNHVVEKAIGLGLDPMRAIRYATINPAQRLRLYHTGAIAPGMDADIQLLSDLAHPKPSVVLCGGKVVVDEGHFVPVLPQASFAPQMHQTMQLAPLCAADFVMTCPVPSGFTTGIGVANMIGQDGIFIRTKRTQQEIVLRNVAPGLAQADTAPYLKVAVCNRYGKAQKGLALIDGMPGVTGAVGVTYGHDCHNLAVFGGNDADMAVAANTVLASGGGICAVQNGVVLAHIALPIAGLLSMETPEALLTQLDAFLAHCRAMGFVHRDLMSFFTTLPLAVSPEIKCTDRGLLDVVNKQFLPFIDHFKEDV